ncbi:MAG: hypothetical protein H6Q59_391 [Firmicutes bacterium]|nr:hypothetical protein [Bacillota bacterium]
MAEGYRVLVRDKALQQDMYYKNTDIMRYTIKYPKFISDTYQTLLNKLNSLYRTKAVMYERSNVMNLYQMAMVEYEYSVANNYPIRQFEAFVDFVVTYNQNCMISLYFDQYEFAGGAHGLTVRYADTWNLNKSKKMELSDFFVHRSNYKEYIIRTINKQIEEALAKKDAMYFDDYEKLVRENFKTNNFYLSKDGLVIFFQQYDIAPYAAGLPTFVIPYGPGGATLPRC